MLSGQASWCRSRVLESHRQAGENSWGDSPGRVEAFFEELAAASGDARQTQPQRADLAAKYRLGYFTELVPALKRSTAWSWSASNSHPVGSQRPTEVPQPTVHRRWIGERAESVDLSGCATW
jgi:hypothetical protein